ncbi:MAG: hypothetical protein Alpg2KO_00570 [Alphaproteobacteria bacterium]
MAFLGKWIPALDTAFDPLTHGVGAASDLTVLDFKIDQTIGEPAALTVETPNPGIGFLSDSAKRNLLLIWAPEGGDPAVLFRGRLIGWPDSLSGQWVSMEFEASPADLPGAYNAFHEANKTAPWWDDLFVEASRRGLAEEGLEGRAQLYDIDRTDLTIRHVDLIGGTVTIDNPTVFRDSFDSSLIDRPLKSVRLRLTANWVQQDTGTTNLTSQVRSAFGDGIYTHTEEELLDNWPEIGALGDSGWTIIKSGIASRGREETLPRGRVLKLFGREWYTKHPFGISLPMDALVLSYDYRQSRREIAEIVVRQDLQNVFGEDESEELIELTLQAVSDAETPPRTVGETYTTGDRVTWGGRVWIRLVDGVEGEEFLGRPLTTPAEAGDPVWQWELAPGGADASALGDARRPRFFDTDRGKQAINHAIAMGLARLKVSAACIGISGTGLLEHLSDISCRDVICITGPTRRIPGGEAVGAVQSYTINGNGANGTAKVSFKLSCVPGTGEAQTSPDNGDPNYVADEFVAEGYFASPVATAGAAKFDSGAGVVWSWDSLPDPEVPVDPGSLHIPGYAAMEVRVDNSGQQQNADAETPGNRRYKVQALGLVNGELSVFAHYVDHLPAPTGLYVRMRQLAGHDVLVRNINVTAASWQAPRQVDLEAGA